MGPDKTPPNMSPVSKAETMVQTDKDSLVNKGELLSRIRLRYDDGVGAFEENRRMHSEDLNFVYNSESMGQWDPVVLEARRGKPNYTFNRVIGPVNIVVADMRQTRPAGKVRPTNGAANEATAEVLAGLMRSIEDESRAEPIYKNQYKFAVAGGFGAWRLMPEYESEDSFDQVLRIKDIPNPQTVIWDPECSDACAGDAMWCIVGERVSKEKYRSLFPNADTETSFNISRDSYGWFTDKEVRVVEYMERVPFEKEIVQFTDGSIQDLTPEIKKADKEFELQGMGKDKVKRILRTRKVLKWRVMWCKCDGGQILEGPIFYDWRRIPVVRVPGRYINIEGRKKLQSLIRHAKDAQRTYNSRVCDMIERSAMIPKAPYLVTETMIKGYEADWNQSNVASRPYLPYNIDKSAPNSDGMPFRNSPIDMPQGALALAQQAAQDIQATTGYFDPAIGNAEDMNRVSGKALIQHTRRSDLGSFEFTDGYADALQLTWEMGIDMAPTIYDSDRVVRIVGNDEIEKMVSINSADPQSGDIIHDLKVGSYSCKVSIGPNYQTARQEALNTMIDAADAIPMIAQVAPDLLAKNIDFPDADELTRRLRLPLIQQGLIKPTPEEMKNMPPPKPNPQQELQEAELARMKALAQRDAASATIQQHKVQMIPLETHKQTYETAGKHLANLKIGAELGQQDAAAQAEAQAAQTDLAQQQVKGLQDMHQQRQQHEQDLDQQTKNHHADYARQQQAHAAEMERIQQKHSQMTKHAEEVHAQKKKHAEELNAQKVELAKKLAAAKPKKAPKAK
jgi:Phage P22-like portal protein